MPFSPAQPEAEERIRKTIEQAQDAFGIVEGAGSLINLLTAEDWRQAATQLYPKDAANPNGFYIDVKDNQVTIHNDTSEADAVAKGSNWYAAWARMKSSVTGELLTVAGAVGVPAVTFSGALLTSLEVEGATGVIGEAILGGAMIGAAAAGIVGVAAGADYLYNLSQANAFKQHASDVASTAATVTFSL